MRLFDRPPKHVTVQLRASSFRLFVRLMCCAVAIPAFLISGQSDPESDTSAVEQNGFAFYPIAFYTPETRIAGGGAALYFFRNHDGSVAERPTTIAGDALYTQNEQLIIEGTSSTYFNKELYRQDANFFYYKFPNRFYGIGNSTADTMREDYTYEAVRVNPAFLRRFSSGLYIGLQYHYEWWDIIKSQDGKLLSQKIIPGSSPTTVSGTGITMMFDTRDNIFAPFSGWYAQVTAMAFPKFLGSTFSFTRYRFDVREYHEFVPSHVLATQVYVSTTTGDVPFRFLSQIGGQSSMRGYFEGRFRDNHCFAIQTEYRFPVWWRFGLIVHGGIGEVAHTIGQFSTGQLKYSWGTGLRFAIFPKERLNLRLDTGFGENTSGVYIGISEAI